MTHPQDTPLPDLRTAEERERQDAERAAAGVWYESFVTLLATSQQASATHLAAAATSYTAIAAHLESAAAEFRALSRAAAALAESVPTGDQAAADLGTAVERHLIANLHTVLHGEQDGNRHRDAEFAAFRRDYDRDRRDAAAQRAELSRALTLVLQALGATEGL